MKIYAKNMQKNINTILMLIDIFLILLIIISKNSEYKKFFDENLQSAQLQI